MSRNHALGKMRIQPKLLEIKGMKPKTKAKNLTWSPKRRNEAQDQSKKSNLVAKAPE
ncbi:hypothetical protein [Heyndrickxia sporothermodurans]|uniref:Uncharacterized protein n=1 Tax=Heyndrickxia sporothermodurans TaxID=46224 RepID=A0AB37HF41_9BACI|nr:hypothetical protein JGZ69_03850 [Heyndrickxia sporothermodurans]